MLTFAWQNNLQELWALLNFVLPEVFGDLATFQSWYAPSITVTSLAET